MMDDTVISNEQRRQQISTVFMPLLAAGFAAARAVTDFKLIYATIPAAVVSAAWWFQVTFLKKLATAKFHAIAQLEEKLAFRPFEEEWRFLKRLSRENEKQNVWMRIGLSQIEMVVPLLIFVACVPHIAYTLIEPLAKS